MSLVSQFDKSRARAEAAQKSKDVTKARELALEQLHPDVTAQSRDNGALELPSRATCDETFDAFFRWTAPLVPILNKSEFMSSYRDSQNQPSMLLMQAVLAAGSTVVSGLDMAQDSVPSLPSAVTYFGRARMLYEANYEINPVTLIQSLILMGWYWEASDGVVHIDPQVAEAAV